MKIKEVLFLEDLSLAKIEALNEPKILGDCKMYSIKILVLEGQQYNTSHHCLLIELIQKCPSFMELKGS
jgi:hypothetical protein